MRAAAESAHPADLRGGARDGHHADRLCRRPARADADGGGGTGGAGAAGAAGDAGRAGGAAERGRWRRGWRCGGSGCAIWRAPCRGWRRCWPAPRQRLDAAVGAAGRGRWGWRWRRSAAGSTGWRRRLRPGRCCAGWLARRRRAAGGAGARAGRGLVRRGWSGGGPAGGAGRAAGPGAARGCWAMRRGGRCEGRARLARLAARLDAAPAQRLRRLADRLEALDRTRADAGLCRDAEARLCGGAGRRGGGDRRRRRRSGRRRWRSSSAMGGWRWGRRPRGRRAGKVPGRAGVAVLTAGKP